MECAKCNREIPDKSKFCPYCGKSIQDDEREYTNTVGISISPMASKELGLTAHSKDIVAKASKPMDYRVDKEKKSSSGVQGYIGVFIGAVAIIIVIIFASDIGRKITWNNPKEEEKIEESLASVAVYSDEEDKHLVDDDTVVNEPSPSDNEKTGEMDESSVESEQFKKDCMPSEYLPYGVNTGNVAADNIAVKQGDWVYFICEGGIYKQNSKGETYIILEEGSMWIHPTNLNICGDYLYFRHEERDTYVNTIDRIRTDGKERETVISDGDIVRGEFSFVCDYEDQLIVCSEKHVKDGYSEDGNDYIASYKRYSLDDESINLEYTPEDYNGRPISSIKIIGMSGGYVYAFENYHNKGGTSKVIAKIEPKSFTIERVEFEQNVSSGVVFNGDSLFVTDDTSHYTLHMVDLDSMSVLYDVTYLNGEMPVACYKNNGDNYVIFSDMWMANVDRFPDNAGKSLGDGSFTNASIIDKSIYYSIKDDYGWSQLYRIGIYNDVNEAVFIQEVTNKLEQ